MKDFNKKKIKNGHNNLLNIMNQKIKKICNNLNKIQMIN